MHQLHFLIPDPGAFLSGGNIYNACLINALARQGIHVSHGEFNPDILLSSPDTLYILDSIFFEKIDKPDTQIPRNCIGLIHHLRSLYPLSEEYLRRYEQPILQNFKGFIVTSGFTRDYLTHAGFSKDKIQIIEPSPIISDRAKRQSSSKVHALMVGSCIPRKGQLDFLNALQHAKLPPYTLSMVGSLSMNSSYAQRCAESILQSDSLRTSVRLLGEQDTSTVQRLYQRANLFVSAAEMETFGMAIQDAVASGIPVLALDRGYAAQHIEPDVNGVRCRTIDELVDAFERCVVDFNYFLELQKRAMSFQPRYHTWDVAAQRMIEGLGIWEG